MNKIKRFAAVALVMAMAVSAAGPAYAEKSKDYNIVMWMLMCMGMLTLNHILAG